MFKVSILLINVFLCLVSATTAGQDKQDDKDSCISRMKIFSFRQLDSTSRMIEKRTVENLIEKIKACENQYEYPPGYQDQSFELVAPVYLRRTFYTFGNNSFAINFYDTTDSDRSTIRSITIEYDFDSSYKKFFLEEIETGKIKADIENIEEKKLYLFTNWEGKFCGKLFLENNTFIFYCTRDQEYEKGLQKAILGFKWK